MRRSKTPFPRLTWASCECGCGFEGEDDVTQFCIEEAALIHYDAFIAAQQEAEEAAERERAAVADAMAKAKQLHFERFGVRT